jgi:hypothetical protein
MKNIHILPTDKPSKKGDIVVWNGLKIWNGIGEPPHHNLNIYITSDDKYKVGDWIYDNEDKEVSLIYDKNYLENILSLEKNRCKKIILTTDSDLIKDGVQSIDDEFLEWFVKNPSCEEVELDIETELDAYYRNGIGGARPIKIIIPQEEPKKETIEDAAKIWVNNRFTKQICGNESYPDIHASKEGIVESHILFAKWQQERMYSDIEVFTEELKDKIDSFEYSVNQNSYISDYIKEWFEQFKKTN